DMRTALVDVIGRMNRVRSQPQDAERPVIQIGGGGGDANDSLSWFFVQLLPGTEGTIADQRSYIEDVVKPRIESVPGVAAVNVNAGPPDDIRITVDLARAAALGVGIPEIAQRAARANDVSAGQIGLGRQQYTLRFTGRYKPDDLGELVLAWRDGRPIRLCDVATIEKRPPDQQFFVYQIGNPSICPHVLRSPGANVPGTLEQVNKVVADLREDELQARGLGIEQSYDSSLFIHRAVGLLTENLVIGALLALVCVWWFMRDWRATLLIAIAIPILLLATLDL